MGLRSRKRDLDNATEAGGGGNRPRSCEQNGKGGGGTRSLEVRTEAQGRRKRPLSLDAPYMARERRLY